MSQANESGESMRVSPRAARTPPGTLEQALRLFWRQADAYVKRRLALTLGLVACAALASALVPYTLKLTLDALSSPRPLDGGLAATWVAFACVAAYAAAHSLGRVSTELRLRAFGEAEQRARRLIAYRIFEHLVHLPMRYHVDRKSGAIGETVEQGLRGYELLLSHLVFTILPAIIEFSLVAIVLARYDQGHYLGLLAASALAYGFVFRRGAAQIRAPAHGISDAHIEAHAVLTDSLLNCEAVKYFDAEPVMCTRFEAALSRIELAWRGFLTRRTANGLLAAAVLGLSLLATSWLAARDVMSGALGVGDFVLINMYTLRLVQPVELLGLAARDVAQGLAFLQRLLELLQLRTERPAASVAIPAKHLEACAAGGLAFDRVTFGYGPGPPVLQDVSFEVPAGHVVAIVGASGSGKSSLIRLLFRLYEPQSGEILVGGQPISKLPLSAIRRAIAVVPQDTVLFNDTIAKNIGFGRPGSSRAQIEQAARGARLHERILTMPEGYETIVGERGVKLSGGERQRLAIARALLKDPQILVFDEATSSLDSRTEREIEAHLLTLAHHKTTLVIAHRLSSVVHAHEILVLERGRLLERGTHAELLRLKGIYAGLWLAQQGKAA